MPLTTPDFSSFHPNVVGSVLAAYEMTEVYFQRVLAMATLQNTVGQTDLEIHWPTEADTRVMEAAANIARDVHESCAGMTAAMQNGDAWSANVYLDSIKKARALVRAQGEGKSGFGLHVVK